MEKLEGKPLKLKVSDLKVSGDDPKRLFGHTVTLLPGGKELMVVGGSYQDNYIYIFDIPSNTWSKKEGFMELRYHTACLCHDAGEGLPPSVIVYGGRTIGAKTNSDIFQVASDSHTFDMTMLEKQPLDRWRHTCVSSPFEPECMYIFGGRHGIRCLNDFWKYNAKDKVWEMIWIPRKDRKAGFIPPPRYSHAATIFNYKMLICGGKNTNVGVLNDFWEFDFATNKWAEIKIPNYDYVIPRFLHTLTTLWDSNQLLLSTGFCDNDMQLLEISKKRLAAYLVLDYKEKKFTNVVLLGKGNKIYYDVPVIMLPDNKIYLYGGDHRVVPKKMKGVYQECADLENKTMMSFVVPAKILTKREVPPKPELPPQVIEEEEEEEEEGESDEEKEGEKKKEEEIKIEENLPPAPAEGEVLKKEEEPPKVDSIPVQPMPVVQNPPSQEVKPPENPQVPVTNVDVPAVDVVSPEPAVKKEIEM